MTPSPTSAFNLELGGIERLLLTPNPAAMQDVERRLGSLIARIQRGGTTHFEPGVRASVSNIRFLLDSARQFWSRRGFERAPGQQYSAGGALVENPSDPTFAMEL